jgi:hypothetical protein
MILRRRKAVVKEVIDREATARPLGSLGEGTLVRLQFEGRRHRPFRVAPAASSLYTSAVQHNAGWRPQCR